MSNLNLSYKFNGNFIIKYFVPFYSVSEELPETIDEKYEPSYFPMLNEKCGCFKLSFVCNEPINKIALYGTNYNYTNNILYSQQENIYLGTIDLDEPLEEGKIQNVYCISKIEQVNAEYEPSQIIGEKLEFDFDENTRTFLYTNDLNLNTATKLALINSNVDSLKYNNSHVLNISCNDSPEIVPLQLSNVNNSIDFLFKNNLFKISDYKTEFQNYCLPVFDVYPLNSFGKKGTNKKIDLYSNTKNNSKVLGLIYNTSFNDKQKFPVNVISKNNLFINNDNIYFHSNNEIIINCLNIKDTSYSPQKLFFNCQDIDIEPINFPENFKFAIGAKKINFNDFENRDKVIGILNNNVILNDSILIYSNNLFGHLSAPQNTKYKFELSPNGIKIDDTIIDINWSKKDNIWTDDDIRNDETIKSLYKNLSFSISVEKLKEYDDFNTAVTSIREQIFKPLCVKFGFNTLNEMFDDSFQVFVYNNTNKAYTINSKNISPNRCVPFLISGTLG